MAHRSKELMRVALAEMERQGATVIEKGKTGGSHQYIEFVVSGARGKLFMSFSPRSSATDFMRSEVRKAIRQASERAVIPAGLPH